MTLIHARKAIFPITTMGHVLGISASAYYAWAAILNLFWGFVVGWAVSAV